MHRHEQGFSHVLLFVLFVVVIGAIGFTGWRVHQLQSSKSSPPPSKATHVTADTYNATDDSVVAQICNRPATVATYHDDQDAKSITVYVCKTLATTYRLQDLEHNTITTSHPGPVGVALSFTTDTSDASPVWYAPGYNFSTATNDGSRITVQPQSTTSLSSSDTVQQSMNKALLTYGMKRINAPTSPIISSVLKQSYYQNASTICSLDPPDSAIVLACSPLSSYVSASQTLKPLIDAYYIAEPASKPRSSFVGFTFENSKTSGYRIAQGFITGGPFGGFYEKNNQWYFVEGDDMTGIITCDLSKTQYPSDARLAFLGKPCLDIQSGKGDIITVQ